ncbi:MAG: hypothetical protein N2560_07190 [Ignavibacteria bacterium]|nr:hypothetical protein [Ignavibacteria bacterium]
MVIKVSMQLWLQLNLSRFSKKYNSVMKNFFACLLFFLTTFSFLTAQTPIDLTNWTVYSSQMNAISVTLDRDGNLWCATNGGVYSFNPQSSENFVSFNSMNGLYSIDTKFITYNQATNEIYVGTYDGVLSIYNKDNEWENILDIRKSKFTRFEINHILFQDTIAYICGGFGLTTFDTRKKVFLKTPSRLGAFPSGTSCKQSIIYNNYLWVATESGIARIRLNQKITNPDSWENFSTKELYLDADINFLAVENDVLYAFASTTIYRFNGKTFDTLATLPTYDKINSVQVFGGKIYFSTPNVVRNLNMDLIYFIAESPQKASLNGFYFFENNKICVLLNKSGLALKNLTTGKIDFFLPKSPISNQFTYFDVTKSGGFWSATNSDPRGEGLMYLKNGSWVNFTTFTNSSIKTNNFTKVTCVADTVYASTWGNGLYMIYPSADTFVIKIYDNTNSPLTGIPANPNYVVVEQTAYEQRKSILWIVNYSDAKSGYLLVAKDKKGQFHGFIYTPVRKFHNLLIDEFGTKWISSVDGTGLYYFNERGTLDDTTDDIYSNLIWNTNLPSNKINTMAFDYNGYIWCGTDKGMFLILNPGAVLNNSIPVIKKLKMLEDYPINCIHIDALNYKWIATNKGVFVVSPDGSEILLNLTKDNSDLLSDEILHIKSNPANGNFYFGTSKGLVVATSMIVQPLDNYDIFVYPQPLHLPKDQHLLIDGLAMDTEIKILTVNGEIVRTILTQSKKTIWDGKDDNGNYVATGIYLLVAKSLTTKESAVYKIAVIKE